MVDLFKCFCINWLPSSLVASHQLFTLVQSITQQQNGFPLCCGKPRENNFNNQSSYHENYKNRNLVCFDSIECKINQPFNPYFLYTVL